MHARSASLPADLKGLAASMLNQAILVNTLALQEARDRSAIEDIVTTHDELFRSATYPDLFASYVAKEVRPYVQALRVGFGLVKQTGLLTAMRPAPRSVLARGLSA